MTNEARAAEQLSVRLFFRAALRLAALVAVLGAAAAISFGYLGWLHLAFDSFSHFRIHFAVGLILLALPLLALRFLPEAAFAVLLGATTIFQTVGLPTSQFGTGTASASADAPEGAVYRLLQMNLRFDNPHPERALSLIGALRPDIVTLNEVSQHWMPRLRALASAYPYSVICEQPSYIGGSAVLSRRPFAAGFAPRCQDRGSYGQVTLDVSGTTVDVVGLHLGWPWPFHQPGQLPQVTPYLGGLGDTAIVAGDFNSVPWSHTAQRIADASGTRVLRGIGPTWLLRGMADALRRWVGLPIDNVLVKGGIVPVSLKTVDSVGSDHLPVLFEFMLLPEEKPAAVLQAMAGE